MKEAWKNADYIPNMNQTFHDIKEGNGWFESSVQLNSCPSTAAKLKMNHCCFFFLLLHIFSIECSIELFHKGSKGDLVKRGEGKTMFFMVRSRDRGHQYFGLAAIFTRMLYNVQIIQKSTTRNIMHMNIIVLKLPAKLRGVID